MGTLAFLKWTNNLLMYATSSYITSHHSSSYFCINFASLIIKNEIGRWLCDLQYNALNWVLALIDFRGMQKQQQQQRSCNLLEVNYEERIPKHDDIDWLLLKKTILTSGFPLYSYSISEFLFVELQNNSYLIFLYIMNLHLDQCRSRKIMLLFFLCLSM